jgi:hypothetical protein
MGRVTPRHVTIGSTAENDVFYAVRVDSGAMQQYRNYGKLCFLWLRSEPLSG